MESNRIYFDSDLKEMSKHGRKNKKAYEAFKRVPSYYSSTPVKTCYYKHEVSCNKACLLYEYCTKREKH